MLHNVQKVQHEDSLGESLMSCQAEAESSQIGMACCSGLTSTVLQTPRIPNTTRLALDHNEFTLKLLRFKTNVKENMFFNFFTLLFLSH